MSLIKTITWNVSNNFDDSTFVISSPAAQQVDTISFYGSGYAHSEGQADVVASVSLYDPDTSTWHNVGNIPIPASGGTSSHGGDALDFNNLSLTFPLQRVSKIRLHGTYVGTLYRSMANNTIDLSLSEVIERPFGQTVNLIGEALVAAPLRVIYHKDFDTFADITNDATFTSEVDVIRGLKASILTDTTIDVGNLRNAHIVKLPPASIEGNATVTNASVAKIGRAKGSFSGSGTVQSRTFQKYRIIKASLETDSDFESFGVVRDIRREMLDYLPNYYDSSVEVDNIMTSEASELKRLSYFIYNVLDQFFLDTATWGLKRWEAICGLKEDPTLNFEQRRNRVKQRLVGYGTLTKNYLKEQFEYYYQVDIEEVPREYQVIITLTQMRAVPESLKFYNEFLDMIKNIIPAHLIPVVKFTYVPWTEFKTADIRWGDISKLYTWRQLKTQYYEPPIYKYEETLTWSDAEGDGMVFDDISLTWDNFRLMDPTNTYPDVEEFLWSDLDETTWTELDSQITNKWEVAI